MCDDMVLTRLMQAQSRHDVIYEEYRQAQQQLEEVRVCMSEPVTSGGTLYVLVWVGEVCACVSRLGVCLCEWWCVFV